MNIVTSADHRFFHCLQGFVDSVWEHYGQEPIVYDLGLTEPQRRQLRARVLPIDVDLSYSNQVAYGAHSMIRATQKPFCINRYFDEFDEPMMLVDADCVFTARVEETGFDVGVTLRSGRGFDPSNRWTGLLNSGVVIANRDARELMNAWADECLRPDTGDQKALVDVLAEAIDWNAFGWNREHQLYDWRGSSVKVLPCDEFNDHRFGRQAKIIHFKGQRHHPLIYPRLLEAHRRGGNVNRLYRRLAGKDPLSRWTGRIRRLIGWDGNPPSNRSA